MKSVHIIGAGFFGLTMAHLITEKYNIEAIIHESRDHIGGNAFSYIDAITGIEVHKYGTHLFHTSNSEVIEFITKFDKFNNYNHVVWANARGKNYSLPVNLSTIAAAFGVAVTPNAARNIIANEIASLNFSPEEKNLNLRNKALSSIGVTLYELLVEGYTRKQWNLDPEELPASVITRLPVRFNFNNSYFSDTFQGLPVNGYQNLFLEMISNRKIKIETGKTWSIKDLDGDLTIYTGPVDRFFNYECGPLNWRTLDLQIEHHEVEDFQGTAVMNYSDANIPFTRIHEFKHLHPERPWNKESTVVMREFSRWAELSDEPYYPVNSAQDKKTLEKYRNLIAKEKNVLFGGRLGSYQYLDMHMAIASAMSQFRNDVIPRLNGCTN